MHRRLPIWACASALALALGLAPPAQATGSGSCLGTLATVAVTAGGPTPVIITTTANSVVVDGTATTCTGLTKVTINGDATLNNVEYTSATAVTVEANLFGNDDRFKTTGTQTSTVNAGDGEDTLIGGAGTDIFNGGNDGDDLTGGAGDDVLHGDGGVDTLTGDLGVDNVDGGTQGDTVFEGDGFADVVTGGAAPGDDTLTYASSAAGVSVDLAGGGGVDAATGFHTVVGSIFADDLRGDSTDNVIQGGLGKDTLRGGGGMDELDGQDGDDTIYGDDQANDNLKGGADTDELTYLNEALGVTVFLDGTAGTDTATSFENAVGGNGADTMTGSSGPNTISGGPGADHLHGGGDNDTLNGEDGADEIFGDAMSGDILTGGAGGGSPIDVLTYADEPTTPVTVNFGGVGPPPTPTDTASGFERAIGGGGNDTLIGDSGGQELDGGSGDDQINGFTGTDVLHGDGGTDTITGDGGAGDTIDGGAGAEIDILTYASVGTSVTINLGVGASDDDVSEIEHLIGGGVVDILTGDSGPQQINGGPGNDQINGGGGMDKLYGDADDDTIAGDDSNGDTLDGVTGNDTLTYAGVTSVVTVDLTGTSDDLLSNFDRVIGGSAGDLLTGDGLNNRFDGGGGNDVIAGNGGVDTLNGDGDADLLTGGGGADFVNGGADADTVFEDEGTGDQVAGGTGVGNDILTYAGAATGVSVDLAGPDAATDTTSEFEVVIGSAFDDTLTGDSGDQEIDGGDGIDVLEGDGGTDVLKGQAGDDTILGDNDVGVDTFDGGTGTDILTYAAIAAPVTVNLAGGGDTISEIEHLIGGSGGDTLTGDSDNQTIDGGPGDDELHGGGGDDHLNGDGDDDEIFGDGVAGDALDGVTGDDILTYADVTTPVVVNLGGGGPDTVSNFDHVIGGSDDDTLTGDANGQTIDGGPGDDDIVGLAGMDKLNGDGGDDDLTGGGDADTVRGGADTDTIVEDEVTGDDVAGGTGAGTDVLTYATAGGPVIVKLGAAGGTDTASEFEHVIGSGFGDMLTGDAGDQLIEGGQGPDQLDGGDDGDDELDGGDDADIVSGDDDPGDTLRGGPGADILTYALVTTPVIVNLSGGGDDDASAFEHVIGGSAGDTITGDSHINELDGGGGPDTLAGAEGADIIDGEGGSDTASYAERNTGVVVSLVAAGEDTLTLIENLTGSGGDDTLTGDGNANIINGGNGADTINGGADMGDTLIGGSDAGHDILSYAGETNPVVINFGGTGPAGTDSVSQFEEGVGGNGADTLVGNANPNTLRGGPGADTLTGEGAADVLAGDGGTDTITGGAGADMVDGGDDADILVGEADPGDTLDGGPGRDLLTYAGVTTAIVVDLTTPVPFLARTDAATNVEDVAGGSGDDTIAGDDVANTLSGGPGLDTVSYGSRGAGVDVSLDGHANDGSAGVAEGDNVIAENVTGGGGDDRLVGGQGINDLRGIGGNDTIVGRGGSDTLDGGSGTDTLSYEDRGAGQGVSVSLDGAGGGTGELDTFTQFERLVGGAGDDSLTGSAGGDELAGAAGADVLAGAGGNDVLAGDAGPDTLSGGAGSDSLSGGADNDRLDGGPDPDAFDGGTGDDDISAFDGTAENVVCGDGFDRADHDLADSFSAADCESRVLLGYVPPPFALDPRQRDRDRDGSFAGTDCNDFDPSIRPGGPDGPGDGIDQDCDGADAPFPPITTEFRLRFRKAERGTRLLTFELRRVPAGAKVVVTCKSKVAPRCVFASRTTTLKSARTKLSVRGYFGDRPLSNGTTIEARVSVAKALGRNVKIAIRKRGQNPKLVRGCLALDGKTATACS